MLLPEEPGNGELDHRGRLRVGGGRRGELDLAPSAASTSRYRIAPSPTANTSSGPASSSADQVLGRLDDLLGRPEDPAGDRPVQGDEDLAAAAVDHRRDGLWVVRLRNASASRLAIPTMGAPVTCASVFAVSTPTRSPVNRPGPTPTANPPTRHIELGPGSSCSSAGVTDLLPGPAGDRDLREDLGLGADRDARPAGLMSRSPGRSRRHAPRRGHGHRAHPTAPAHEAPSAETRSRRHPIARILGGELDAEPLVGPSSSSTASPHSTSSTPSPSPSSSSAEVDHVLHPFRPVDVDVRDVEDAPVLLHQRERGRRHLVLDPPSPRATPCTKVVLPAPSSPVSTTASRGARTPTTPPPPRGCPRPSGPEAPTASQNSSNCCRPDRSRAPRCG